MQVDPKSSGTSRIRAAWQPGVIDLGPGHPSDDLLPLALLRRAAQTRLAHEDVSYLHYGIEQGHESFRELLASFLEAETGVATDVSQLFVTSGASQALDVICTLYTRPGETVLVAEPTYFLALEVFKDHGLNVKGVACDSSGVVPGALAEALRETSPALLYLVPSFANPTGVTLSHERMQQVVDMTAGTGTLVVADEAYRFLPFDGLPPASMAGPDRPHVLSINSFSKTLAPGLRLGWLAGPEPILMRIAGSGFLRSGGGLNPFTAAVVGSLIESGELSDHIRWLRSVYQERAAALVRGLREQAPQFHFEEPTGGYFVWARVDGVDAITVRELARGNGADVAPGFVFSPTGAFTDHVRLSFSHYTPEELVEGAFRLGVSLSLAQGG